MTISNKLLSISKRICSNFYRNYSKSFEKELEVPTFCDVYITVPYSINIKPLNIHKYHNCDKLIITHDGVSDNELECNINGNHVTIIDKTSDSTINCDIKVPIKANLYVVSKRDITVGQLNGDKISLESKEGNITVDKFQGDNVKVSTETGNIKFKDVVQASNIEAIVTESGSINTGRVQGLNIRLKTNKGDMVVESSYCNESIFEVQKGNMDLSNIHKTCQIFLNEGQLNLNGFDGKLSALIEKGNADIYLSKIMSNSYITLTKGSLQLKLAEVFQDHVKFIINAKECDYSEDFKNVQKDSNNCVTINPHILDDIVSVNCLKGLVNIDCATWKDMIKIKLQK